MLFFCAFLFEILNYYSLKIFRFFIVAAMKITFDVANINDFIWLLFLLLLCSCCCLSSMQVLYDQFRQVLPINSFCCIRMPWIIAQNFLYIIIVAVAVLIVIGDGIPSITSMIGTGWLMNVAALRNKFFQIHINYFIFIRF